MNLDNYGFLINRRQLNSDLPVVGVWYGKADETEVSDLILNIFDNEIFSVEGFLYVDERKVFNYSDNEYFIIEDTIRFNGNGRYYLEGKDNIVIKGGILVHQKTCCNRFSDNEKLIDTKYMEKNYTRSIDFSGKFTRTDKGDKVKLLFDNPNGLITFEDEVFDGKYLIKGFREFDGIVEIRPI